MLKFTEPRHTGEHIVSEANGDRSREEGVLAAGNNLVVGAVLGRITASGLYTELAPGAVDGSEVAAAVLYAAVDATAADTKCVVHVRDCEVAASQLAWPAAITGPQQTTAEGELAAAGIIIR